MKIVINDVVERGREEQGEGGVRFQQYGQGSVGIQEQDQTNMDILQQDEDITKNTKINRILGKKKTQQSSTQKKVFKKVIKKKVQTKIQTQDCPKFLHTDINLQITNYRIQKQVVIQYLQFTCKEMQYIFDHYGEKGLNVKNYKISTDKTKSGNLISIECDQSKDKYAYELSHIFKIRHSFGTFYYQNQKIGIIELHKQSYDTNSNLCFSYSINYHSKQFARLICFNEIEIDEKMAKDKKQIILNYYKQIIVVYNKIIYQLTFQNYQLTFDYLIEQVLLKMEIKTSAIKYSPYHYEWQGDLIKILNLVNFKISFTSAQYEWKIIQSIKTQTLDYYTITFKTFIDSYQISISKMFNSKKSFDDQISIIIKNVVEYYRVEKLEESKKLIMQWKQQYTLKQNFITNLDNNNIQAEDLIIFISFQIMNQKIESPNPEDNESPIIKEMKNLRIKLETDQAKLLENKDYNYQTHIDKIQQIEYKNYFDWFYFVKNENHSDYIQSPQFIFLKKNFDSLGFSIDFFEQLEFQDQSDFDYKFIQNSRKKFNNNFYLQEFFNFDNKYKSIVKYYFYFENNPILNVVFQNFYFKTEYFISLSNNDQLLVQLKQIVDFVYSHLYLYYINANDERKHCNNKFDIKKIEKIIYSQFKEGNYCKKNDKNSFQLFLNKKDKVDNKDKNFNVCDETSVVSDPVILIKINGNDINIDFKLFSHKFYDVLRQNGDKKIYDSNSLDKVRGSGIHQYQKYLFHTNMHFDYTEVLKHLFEDYKNKLNVQ